MRTLTMRIKAPLMSWGDCEGYQNRTTASHPTKSGIIGMTAAMLGRPRSSDISDLAALRYGCQINQPGSQLIDLQTMGIRSDTHDPNPLQDKHYLMDADFTIGLEAADDNTLLDRLADAVRHPVYAPYLGRRSCPPAGPIETQILDGTLEETLQGDVYVETTTPTSLIRTDHPYGGRRFGIRFEKHLTPTDPYLNLVEQQ